MEKKKRDYKKEYEKYKDTYKAYHAKHKDKYKKLNEDWISKNRERYNASKWILYDKNKRKIINKISGGENKCSICGIDDIEVLTIDHVNNDGAKHRKEIVGTRRGGIAAYRDYRLLAACSDYEVQILCMNCNLKKEMLKKHEMKMKNKLYANYYNSL